MREIQINIPEGLYRLIEKHLKDLGAESVEEFVIKAARKMLTEVTGKTLEIDEKEKEEIRKKLRELGYID